MTKQEKQFVPEPDESVFKDRGKEAKFWEENFDKVKRKSVKVQFTKKLKHVYLTDSINIRLDPQTSTVIREEAKKKGLGPTQLIRMWILEKIHDKNIRIAGV